jgi:hypothetical protein
MIDSFCIWVSSGLKLHPNYQVNIWLLESLHVKMGIGGDCAIARPCIPVATAAKARITSAAVVSRSVIGSIAVNMVNTPLVNAVSQQG